LRISFRLALTWFRVSIPAFSVLWLLAAGGLLLATDDEPAARSKKPAAVSLGFLNMKSISAATDT
jgi:hypothetical protein